VCSPPEVQDCGPSGLGFVFFCRLSASSSATALWSFSGERDRTEAGGGWQGVSESAVSAKVRPEVTWNDCLTRRS
jgi:hypothetical protein